MRAVGVIPAERKVRLINHPAPGISRPHDVKVKTLEVGVCGTDKEICAFEYGSPPAGYDYLVIGHEALGQVVEVGDGVSSLKPGDYVVPSVRRPCADPDCLACRADLQDFCSTGGFTERGIKMTHGFLTEYFVEEEKYLTHVPQGLRDMAVLVEPLTVAEKALTQIWQVQQRLPWSCPDESGKARAHCRRALVLGAGPVGILGAMTLVAAGFQTYVYSRSAPPHPKADLVQSFGAEYISSERESVEQLAERIGNIDLVYEAVGVAKISFEVMKVLGTNGIFVFTGIPSPKPPIGIEADLIMRNLVLKNQAVIGTVNADRPAFDAAIRDLALFNERWPDALRAVITGRYPMESFRELLFGQRSGIKNVISLERFHH